MSALPVDPHLYLTFLAVMAVMAMTPGPANIFAVATGMQKGRAAVLMAVAGMNAATLVWFSAAALGLGALVKAFPEAFRVLAVGGALYVAWLGAQAIRGAFRTAAEPSEIPVRKGRSAFVDGFTVQIANPKAILFFTAVLPPFLDVNRSAAPQLALFACATIGMDVITMTAYGMGGAALKARMTDPRFQRKFGIAVGGLLLLASVLILVRL
ncbi:LysE family translocator [Brevundimonas sp. BAL450]|jgi:threonine/homoserine/homoserine lactone efflux protein|uniref:Transmembrane amino acid efflux protein n=1 Tax=Brevundimonas abyssalis TAR-001 TaxID=1391729 RepID=A0A8E0NBI1_9CAUL|nr:MULTISPECIES: LysE family translocator [Brevundimonas]MBG7614851.1 LysE family translocator [Brevundimonas sp. BAL450]GAD59235.1 transmembrane amino acid efflux protein [Brevundimonas abyssalis TAR-001]